jgi:hypothetical protein
MHSGTPWVNPTPSKTPPLRPGLSQPPFASDRFSPKPQQQKQKGPKSPEVKRLDSILSGLRSLAVDRPLDQKGPDPKGGCFCQGECATSLNPTFPFLSRAQTISIMPSVVGAVLIHRLCGLPKNKIKIKTIITIPLCYSHTLTPSPLYLATGRIHALSAYTPVCHTCGLPLCSINLPYHPCPHPPCRTSLLSSTPDPFRVQIQPLIARIENEIRDQLNKEENERILAAEELRVREGAFPMLRKPSPSPTPSQNQGYAVMSLTGARGGKRSQITLASYRPGNISKSSSSSSLKKEAEAEEVVRIRCPPSQVEPIKAL